MPQTETESCQNDYLGPTNRNWAIFLISVLGLFLEMLFIRWIGTEIRIFAYLQNTVLVVCFLGLGLGCFTCRQPIKLRQILIPLAFLVCLLGIPTIREALGKISGLLSALGDLVIWQQVVSASQWASLFYVVLGLATTYCLLVFILNVFVPIGRILGRLMDDHPETIWAYSVNVAGSLAGTWLYVLVCFFNQPPFTWFVIVAILVFFFVNRAGHGWRRNLVLLVGIVALSWVAGLDPGSLKVIWSPYQKLTVREPIRTEREIGKYLITVNNIGYQMVDDLSAANTASNTIYYPPQMSGLSQYDIPLLLHPDPKTYLIVGAGAGNDAAGGLRFGVPSITAVEIDPTIISLGRLYHPEKPYESPAVKIIIDDARSFFATTDMKFDVISFGLLDSHTTNAMTNARLDNYVYTRESIARAKSLLTPGGILVLSFEAQRPYIADRIASVLKDVFNEEPLLFRIPPTGYGWGGVMFITGDLAAARQQIGQNQRLKDMIDSFQVTYPISVTYTTSITTDDWPYLYLESRKIPVLYFLLAGLLFLVFIRGYKIWRADGLFTRWERSHWHFFFLGAAFLLLEVQNISKVSVILGNTWQVNAVIVSGVLVMALLANLLAKQFPKIPIGLAYFCLVATCLSLFFIDLAQFAFLPYMTKALVVGSLTALPMLFSGVIFIRSFTKVVHKNEALGANMIGALVGALLQSVTFVTGIRALLIIVAAFYCLSLLAMPRSSKEVPTL